MLMDGRDSQSKAVSGTGCGISLKQSPVRINVCSTEAQPLKRLTTGRMTALACSIGPGKVLQVCHVSVCSAAALFFFSLTFVLHFLGLFAPLHYFQ